MKRASLFLLSCFLVQCVSGCMATLNTETIGEVPSGAYTVTIVKADTAYRNDSGRNYIVLFDIKDERALTLHHEGRTIDSRDVRWNDIDMRGLSLFSISDERGNTIGYVGVAGEEPIMIFENGSVVVGDTARGRGGGDGGGG